MKLHGIAAMCGAIAIALSGPVQAAGTSAVLSAIEGDVRVNQGEQFVAAQAGAELAAGDRVMVAQDASAELTFADGCRYSVAPGTMITVPAISTCAGGAALAQSIQPAHTGALGGTAGTPPPFLLGVAALAAATYVVVDNASSSDKPLSP
jgi:hypothetical protein